MKIFGFALLFAAPGASADIVWPEYSQQCQDDAGPPFVEDEPNVKYHAGSSAYPVLNNGKCAGPIKEACNQRLDFKTAYLEGPISCGDNGWYCRIFNDEANGWANINLQGDVNFGQCNSEDSFEDAGYDQDGHCHGSSVDSTYYWWIRDHWFRQYNGKVRCCCGWYQGGSQPLFSGRIANRCDYRRLVTKTEDVNECRDANEDHNLGYDDVGCDPQYMDQIGSPIPEDDSVCWEIERFGYTEEGGAVPTFDPAVSPNPTPKPSQKLPTPQPSQKVGSPPPTEQPTTPMPTVKSTPKPTEDPTSRPTTKPTTKSTPKPTEDPTTQPPEEDEDLRAIICGRGYGCNGEDIDLANIDELREVRCCRDCDDDSCGRAWKQKCGEYDPGVFARSKIAGKCYKEDFCTAIDICAGVGGRLCTPEEVYSSCTKGTGCSYDSELVWACMYEGGDCEFNEECCSGMCGEDGTCSPWKTGGAPCEIGV